MIGFTLSPLLAVHISDGVLAWPWWVGGYVGAAILFVVGAWRVRDEEIPNIALLTAAFFVGCIIRVPVGGVTTVHLLLNGLMGVLLGWRVAIAIPVGLFLQYALSQHGGFNALGINTCIMTLPALGAWQLFNILRRVPCVKELWFRASLIAVSTLIWTLSLVYSVVMLCTNPLNQLSTLDLAWANRITFHPLTLLGAVILAGLAAWAERRLDHAPEFPIGLIVGELAVLATILLNVLVLIWGGQEDWPTPVLVTVVPYLMLAVLEGIVLGFTVGFLARVKPEMLNGSVSENTQCLIESIP
jgi:cobalt/nickel transport system permease protein